MAAGRIGLAGMLLAIGAPLFAQQLETHPFLEGPARADAAFTHVNVLTMTSAQVLRNQIVVVRNGRVAEIGPEHEVRIPSGIRSIDAAGGYLLPGLADMHVHSGGNPLSLALFLANGVTTVREMSGRAAYLQWARKVESGQILGPTILTTGPILGARSTGDEMVAIATVNEAIAAVGKQYDEGYRILKPYTFLPADAYQAAMRLARAKGMYVVGHVPYSVGTNGVIAAGQNEIAHVHSFHQDYFIGFDPRQVFATYRTDGGFPQRIIPRLKRANVAVTTTLIVDQALADSQDIGSYLARPSQAYETAAATALMRSSEWGFNKLWPHDYLTSVYLPYLYRLTRSLHRAGVRLVLGTDSGTPGVIHGFSAHEELALLVKAGLTPFAALLTSTRIAASVTGSSPEWGTIEVGKCADLLLVRDNPLKDIHRTREIAGVMKAGRWLDRGTLDRLLREIREAYR